jgi:hypothetical protein
MALEYLETIKFKFSSTEYTDKLLEIAKEYIQELFTVKDYQKICKVAKKSFTKPGDWDNLVYQFGNIGTFNEIITVLPLGIGKECTLDSSIYELILLDYLHADIWKFLALIQTWPSNLYNVYTIINAAEGMLQVGGDLHELQHSLYLLYDCVLTRCQYSNQLEKQIYYGLKCRERGMFDIIQSKCLLNIIRENFFLFLDYTREEYQNRTVDPPKLDLNAISESPQLSFICNNIEQIQVIDR